MAGDGETTDLKSHQATYYSVLGMMKYGAVACAVIALIVVYLIAG